MNEKKVFGYELTAITDKFKAKLKDLANDIKTFGKEAEKETTIEPMLVNTGYQKQIDYVKAQMQEIQDVLIDKDKMEPMDVSKLEAEYENLSYKLEELNDKQAEFNEEIDETDKKASSMSSNLGQMFDKSISKIKRFTFYLLGARSVFSLFMKYRSIYYQYNEQMQYQSELSQNAIALSLAPAFEFLGNVIAYASIAFAKFIELLTGVNVLSKVSTKGIRDYNKSLKETQSLLSGVDEITNLTLPSSTGLASQYQALNEFQKKVKEVEKFFKENKWIETLANAVKKIFEWVKKTIDFVIKNWDWIEPLIIIAGLSAIAIKLSFSTIGLASTLGVAGAGTGIAVGTGVAGLAGVLSTLAGIGLIAIGITITTAGIKYIRNAIKEIDEMNQQVHDNWYYVFKGKEELFDELVNSIKKAKKGSKEWNDEVDKIKNSTKDIITNIMHGNLKYDEYATAIQNILNKLDEVEDKGDIQTEIDILTAIVGKDANDKVMLNYLETGNVNLNLNPKVNWDNDKNTKKLFEGQKSSFTIEGKAKLDTSTFKQKLQTIVDIWEKGGKAGIITNMMLSPIKSLLAKLATGTNYVPYDNFPALLHKGEAVVPAKYNPAVNNAMNDYTNALLETLIVKIDDLANRPNVFEIDGQKFANATYGLYEETKNNINYVEGVVR